MPLADTDMIDLITECGADGRYGLIITDADVAAIPETRMRLLRLKLRSYLNAVLSGELEATCPKSRPEDFYIQVACASRPTREMLNISHVVAQNGPRVEIPVCFSEFPEGSWDENSSEEEQEPDSHVSEEMQIAVKAAFTAAAEWLAEDRVPLFILWLEGEEQKLAAIHDAKNQEEVIARVTAWASKFGNPAHLCIQMSAVKSGGGNLPVDTLIARCCERGEGGGFLLAQEISQDFRTGNLVPHGKISFVEKCPGFFPAD